MAACLLTLAGCQPQNVAVSGTVMLDAAPLDEATILFVPLMAGPRKVMARIEGGRYRVPAEGGLLPGEYRVEVADDPPLTPPTSGNLTGHAPPAKRRAFPYRYGQDSPLHINLAAEAGPQVFDFQLKNTP